VPQNQAGYGLSVVPQNRWDNEDDAGHESRSSGLVHVEVSRAKVSQSCLKTGASGLVEAWRGWSRGIIVKVTLGSCRKWMGRCDGLRRTFLS
jgi:hypothetical protein